mmetsp:Transcript_41873/g.61958  ORF Transcript_41873/g.61958 Transcript_41873/m.61958 type:complete len:207 (-) Transcript_41873:11-631(-)
MALPCIADVVPCDHKSRCQAMNKHWKCKNCSHGSSSIRLALVSRTNFNRHVQNKKQQEFDAKDHQKASEEDTHKGVCSSESLKTRRGVTHTLRNHLVFTIHIVLVWLFFQNKLTALVGKNANRVARRTKSNLTRRNGQREVILVHIDSRRRRRLKRDGLFWWSPGSSDRNVRLLVVARDVNIRFPLCSNSDFLIFGYLSNTQRLHR